MKKYTLLLLALMMGVFAFAEAADYPYYAKVVNVSSSLNIRQSGSTKSAVVGKVENGVTVRCQSSAAELSGSSDWVQIQYGGVEGYVKARYLSPVDVAPPAPETSSTKFAGGFARGLGNTRFYVMLVLAIIMFALVSQHSHSSGMVTSMSVVFVLMLLAVWFFIATDVRDGGRIQDLDVFESGGRYWFSRGINIIIVGVYMCALVVGYLGTCYGIADIATDTQEDYQAVSVKIFPLLVVCVLFPWALIVVAPLALWKFGLNCKLMWPKVHYPLIILILGVATCLAILYLFIAIITQLLVAGFFAILILAVLKGSAPGLASSSSSGVRVGGNLPIRNSANGDPYGTDDNGNRIPLRKTDTGYSDFNGHDYDENGYRIR